MFNSGLSVFHPADEGRIVEIPALDFSARRPAILAKLGAEEGQNAQSEQRGFRRIIDLGMGFYLSVRIAPLKHKGRKFNFAPLEPEDKTVLQLEAFLSAKNAPEKLGEIGEALPESIFHGSFECVPEEAQKAAVSYCLPLINALIERCWAKIQTIKGQTVAPGLEDVNAAIQRQAAHILRD